MRSFRHWNPRYFRDRLRVMRYERSHPGAPWLTQVMVSILASWLSADDAGLEWGSGRSTIWFGERVGRLTSVEHDEPWYEQVRSQLNEKDLRNIDYHFCEAESEYVSVTKLFGPNSLDFCLVDGNVRDLCALAAIPLLKPGGILIIDNCNWYLPSKSNSPNSRSMSDGPASEAWTAFIDQVKSWRSVWTTSGVSDTCFWVKPC